MIDHNKWRKFVSSTFSSLILKAKKGMPETVYYGILMSKLFLN